MILEEDLTDKEEAVEVDGDEVDVTPPTYVKCVLWQGMIAQSVETRLTTQWFDIGTAQESGLVPQGRRVPRTCCGGMDQTSVEDDWYMAATFVAFV